LRCDVRVETIHEHVRVQIDRFLISFLPQVPDLPFEERDVARSEPLQRDSGHDFPHEFPSIGHLRQLQRPATSARVNKDLATVSKLDGGFMVWANILLTLSTLVTGLVAATLWFKASRIEIQPLYQKLGYPEPIGGDPTHWVIGIIEASNASAAYNAKAAVWTAASVASSVVAAVLSSPPVQSWIS
jgi:hypothetical protein